MTLNGKNTGTVNMISNLQVKIGNFFTLKGKMFNFAGI